ncbi:histidine kinase [Agromyces sp. MMS24-JH15]|uniref:sensor histidine kinase n=1 Tax=Agromyces sp. MMS24-JH15 TaxID=3243765 RepID=UPI003749BD96
MLNRRWWDVVAVAVVAVIVVITLIDTPIGPQTYAAWGVLAAFLVVYAAYFRGRLGFKDSGHHLAITALLFVILTAGTAFEASFATMQTFAYPYLWVTAPSTRRAVSSNVVLSLGVALGYALHYGWAGALVGAGVAGLSLAFSIGLGLWITRIAEIGDERARLLEELQAAQGELAALHRDAGVTDERARLAREIHDTIAQSLTGLVMVAQRTGNRLSGTDGTPVDAVRAAAAREDVALIEEMAREALTEARGLVAALAPVDVGSTLADALGRLAATFERETGVEVDVRADAAGLGRELEVLLLRTAQEGLANVRKHAHARHAWITLGTGGGAARLTVRDDGVGPGDARPGEGGFGLSGLRDRLALADGRVAFGAAPDGGTELAVEVPLGGASTRLDAASTRLDAAPSRRVDGTAAGRWPGAAPAGSEREANG